MAIAANNNISMFVMRNKEKVLHFGYGILLNLKTYLCVIIRSQHGWI